MGEDPNEREVETMVCSCGAYFAVLYGAPMCPRCGASLIIQDELDLEDDEI
jgi:uncharacterized paraquat-inducible protein A